MELHIVYHVLTPPNKMVSLKENIHIVEMGLSLLAQTSMPLHFWADATSVYLINQLPTPVLDNDTPQMKLLNKPPDY